MDKLIKEIKNKCPPSLQADYDDDNKLIKNVANYGLQIGQMAIRDGGEYNNLTIMALENIKPLLTNYRIIKALEFIKEEKLFEASRVLNIDDFTQKYGFNVVFYVIWKWLQKAGFDSDDIPVEFKKNIIDIKKKDFESLNKWVNLSRADPIMGKMKIVDIGNTKDGTVVPEDWLDREFDSAKELHKEMDKLEWRRSKPPVSYAICYFISVYDAVTWIDKSKITEYDFNLAVSVKVNNNKLETNISEINNKKEFTEWINQADNDIQFIRHEFYNGDELENIIIACDVKKIFVDKPKYIKSENTGVLVSRLQKCIRRGRKCSKLLEETVQKLNNSKPYNLPQQQFIRVSGAKQLVWRLFVSTIEDTIPYLPDPSYLSMQDILCLALVTHIDPKLQFDHKILDQIIYTALLIQGNDKTGINVRLRPNNNIDISLKIVNKKNKFETLINPFKLALRSLPMMGGDYDMIYDGICTIEKLDEKSSDEIKINKLTIVPKNELLKYSDGEFQRRAILASYDMIACPYIILFIQSSLNSLPTDDFTTKNIAEIIWDISSKLNVRNNDFIIPKKYEEFNKVLLDCQNYLYQSDKYISEASKKNIIKKIINNDYKPNLTKGKVLTELESRIGFILIFGKEYRLKYGGSSYDVIVCGDKDSPCKVKKSVTDNREFIEGKERYIIEKLYADHFNIDTKIKLPDPPVGYKWIFNDKYVNIRINVDKSDDTKMLNKLSFYVGDVRLDPFDSSNILESIKIAKAEKPSNEIIELVEQALYEKECKYNGYEINIIMNQCFTQRLENKDFTVYEWKKYGSKIPINIWRSIIVKFNTTEGGKINIGPVDSGGNKIQFSINYQYEGTYLRIFNLLAMLYPTTVKLTSNELIFDINMNTSEYDHLNKSLNQLCDQNIGKIEIPKHSPQIITKLWEHQQKTVAKITYNILELGKRGQGDASDVGAGKTLTSLSIIQKLMDHNFKNKITSHYGAVILLPTDKLYQTWIDEIEKHTKNFDIVTQNSHGELSGSGEIKFNSILVTTLGRMRDHPVSIPWLLCVVDECINVQNSSSQWTFRAHAVASSSQYGVLLLSATFFRSRMDKLYYMLKMLRTGLPEERIYLSAILSESIICNVPAKKRKWIMNITRYKLEKNIKAEYDRLLNQNISSEKLYITLTKFIYDNVDYPSLFIKKLKELEKQKRRVLIFASSKNEADEIAKRYDKISRFPDVSGRHCCASIAEASRGVNQLIYLDCILSKVVKPDVLVQMKGRLDRGLQKANILHLELILLGETIEEANLQILDLENRFRKNFILPLADYYDIAVGRKTIKDIKNKDNKKLKS
jgi:hypothetical protein